MSSRNSEPAVEALDKGVLLRLAGCDVMPLDQHLLAPAQDRPCRSVRRRCRRRTLVARRGFNRAVDGLIDCRRGIDRAAIAPHFFIPALTGEVVGFPDQCLALAPLFRRPLGENARHRPRLRKLFLESFAVAAGQRGRVEEKTRTLRQRLSTSAIGP